MHGDGADRREQLGVRGGDRDDGVLVVLGRLGDDLGGARRDDRRPLVARAREPHRYQPAAVGRHRRQLAGVTLEAATDPSLPQQGPGRADNGNFVLSSFRASFGPPGSNEATAPVKFTNAKASFEQSDYVAAGAIDDKPETGWAIAGGIGKPQSITFDVAPDTIPPAGGLLVVVLDQIGRAHV